jgi:site-specific recombinase XerD
VSGTFSVPSQILFQKTAHVKTVPGFSVSHDLRHTYASHLAMRGVHIRALQELLGHKTLAMTQRYSHLAPEQLQNAVKPLDGVIGGNRELVGGHS